MPDTADLAEFLSAVQQFVVRVYPHATEARVVVVVPAGKGREREAVIEVPLAAGVRPLSKMERRIVELVDSLRPGETLTGEEIADRLQYSMSGGLRETLARLVKQGLIANANPGYGPAD